MKITIKSDQSANHHKSLWRVGLNGDPDTPVRDCYIETVPDSVQIIGVGPIVNEDHNMDLADAQHIVKIHNRYEAIAKCHSGLVKYFEKVKFCLDKHKDHPQYQESKAIVEKFLTVLNSIYGSIEEKPKS